MKRYPHTYGGIATEVGTFPASEIERFFNLKLPAWYGRNMKIAFMNEKVFDLPFEKREVLIYSTNKANEFRVVCINR